MSGGDGWKYMPVKQPRKCTGCGKRIKLSEGAWFKTMPPYLESWHFHCRPMQGQLPLGERQAV